MSANKIRRLDTNVLVSAQRSSRGASSGLISLLGLGLFDAHISVALALEYEDVLMRQRSTLGLTQDDVADLVDVLCALSIPHDIHFRWRPFLRDSGDEFVLELAVAARCDYIVTFNQRDFTGVEQFGIETIAPGRFLELLGAETWVY